MNDVPQTVDGRTEPTTFRIKGRICMMYDVEKCAWVDYTEQLFGSENPEHYVDDIEGLKETLLSVRYILEDDKFVVVNDTVEVDKEYKSLFDILDDDEYEDLEELHESLMLDQGD